MMGTDMSTGVFLSLGSNLGDRLLHLQQAEERLALKEIARSSIYETAPVDFLDQPWFLNCVLQAATVLGPEDLLHHCLQVEKELGRRRDIPKGPRTIDIDILFYNEVV